MLLITYKKTYSLTFILLLSSMLSACGGNDSNKNSSIDDKDQESPSLQWFVENLKTHWEQKDIWSDTSIFPAGNFHPCKAKVFSEYVAVANCLDRRIVTLDVTTGRYVGQISLPDNATAYVNSDYLISATEQEVVYYDGELNQVLEPNNSTTVFHENMSVNAPPEKKFYYSGKNVEIGNILLDPNHNTYDFYRPRFSSHDLRISSYNKVSGEFKEFNSEGVLVASGFIRQDDIIRAVEIEHNKNNLPDISSGFNKSVTYLQDNTWLVVIDDASVQYIQDAFQYLYHANGNVDYLGYFVESFLYIGLSKNTFITYSPMRYIDAGTDKYINPHYFRQFSLLNGELLSEKIISHDDLPPVLYSQEHSNKGVVSVSDSYSTVVLLK